MLQALEKAQWLIRAEQDAVIRKRYYVITRGRGAQYLRRIDRITEDLYNRAQDFSDNGLEQAYRAGWFSAINIVNPNLTAIDPRTVPGAMNSLAGIQDNYMASMASMKAHVHKDTNRFLRDMRNVGDEQLARANVDQKFGIKAVTQSLDTQWGPATRHYRLSDYGKMQTRTANQLAFNTGTIESASKQGCKFFEVVDGPQCGWTSHGDPDRADGRIVTAEEAMANPIAHPNCVRRFIPRPEFKRKPREKEQLLSRNEKIAALSVGLALTGFVAVSTRVTSEIVDPAIAAQYAEARRFGRIYNRAFYRLLDKLQPTGRKAEVLPFYSTPTPPLPVALPQAVGGEGYFPSYQTSFFGPATRAGYMDAMQDWGDAFLNHRIHIPDLPDWVKEGLGIVGGDDETKVGERFMLFAKWVNGSRAQEKAGEAGAKILNFHLKRRQWNEFRIFQEIERLGSGASATWTKYGPRARIDVTDFLRGRITFTKTGIRRSITINPAGSLRAMLALSQDGTLMGAVRLVPNRIFRAIIETDEFGKITGNLRLVPEGLPFRIRMTFETPRPKGWQFTGLEPGKDFVDLRAKARAARGFGLDDFSFREVYETLSQMQLKDIFFEVDIDKMSVFKLSGYVKLPVSVVRESLERLRAEGLVRIEASGWSGVFRWIPTRAVKEELQTIFAQSETKIFANISFSELRGRLTDALPDIRARAYFRGRHFQEILTSFRISGITAIREAKNTEIFGAILELPEKTYSEFLSALQEADARLTLFMRRHGIRGPEWVGDYFWKKFLELKDLAPSHNPAEMYKGVLEAIEGQSNTGVIPLDRLARARTQHTIVPGGPTHQRWLRVLADIKDSDSAAQIEVKLQDMVFYMRALNLDSPSVIETLDQIDDQMIHLASLSLARREAFFGIAKSPAGRQSWEAILDSVKLPSIDVNAIAKLPSPTTKAGWEPLGALVRSREDAVLDPVLKQIDQLEIPAQDKLRATSYLLSQLGISPEDIVPRLRTMDSIPSSMVDELVDQRFKKLVDRTWHNANEVAITEKAFRRLQIPLDKFRQRYDDLVYLNYMPRFSLGRDYTGFASAMANTSIIEEHSLLASKQVSGAADLYVMGSSALNEYVRSGTVRGLGEKRILEHLGVLLDIGLDNSEYGANELGRFDWIDYSAIDRIIDGIDTSTGNVIISKDLGMNRVIDAMDEFYAGVVPKLHKVVDITSDFPRQTPLRVWRGVRGSEATAIDVLRPGTVVESEYFWSATPNLEDASHYMEQGAVGPSNIFMEILPRVHGGGFLPQNEEQLEFIFRPGERFEVVSRTKVLVWRTYSREWREVTLVRMRQL